MTAKAKSALSGKPSKTLRIRQVKSGIGYNEKQKATLKALGLGRIGRTRTVPDNPELRGMLKKIPHLVQWSEEQGGGQGTDA